MPEFELKKSPTKKKKKEKKGFIKSVFPCKGDKVSDVVRKIIVLAAVAVLIYAIVMIIYSYTAKNDQIEQEREYLNSLLNDSHTNDVIQIELGKDDDNAQNDEQKTVEILSEYADLYNENNDMVGYLRVGTLIADGFPVTQYTDNDYYLNHSFLGKESVYGNPYVDYEQQITPTQLPGNVIIYGHNTNLDKNMFNPLTYYADRNYDGFNLLKDTYRINFDTIYERGEYLIFAIFVTNTREDQGEVFEYHKVVNFNNEDEFNDYVSECLDRSYYYTGVDLEYGDQILTLSTCNFTWSDARTVIVARKVRPNESPVLDTSKFIDNSGYTEDGKIKRKMFEAYYNAWGTEWAGRQWDPSYLK